MSDQAPRPIPGETYIIVPDDTCPECGGKGKVLDAPANVLDGRTYMETCSACGGSGKTPRPSGPAERVLTDALKRGCPWCAASDVEKRHYPDCELWIALSAPRPSGPAELTALVAAARERSLKSDKPGLCTNENQPRRWCDACLFAVLADTLARLSTPYASCQVLGKEPTADALAAARELMDDYPEDAARLLAQEIIRLRERTD